MIVRSSPTGDRTTIPVRRRPTAVDRMRRGLPVLVHGDGSSRWIPTCHVDFATAFVGLLGRPDTVGDAFHITNDQWLTKTRSPCSWPPRPGSAGPVHADSDTITATAPQWAGQLLGDMAHSSIFDNAKVKAVVLDYAATIPFAAGAREIIDWFDADPGRRGLNPDTDRALDTLTAAAG